MVMFMETILLSVDIGSSQTKIIYQLQKKKVIGFLVMPPEVEEISQSRLDNFFERRGWFGNPSLEQQLVVSCGERVVVLGEFASSFDPIDRLKELKYENALWKVLGAIGLIIHKSETKIRRGKQLKLKLAVLLPWNEYNDRRRFREQLETMLAEFKVCEDVLNVSLDFFLCRPEGGGLAAARIKELGMDSFRSQNLAVLMLGHRNTTALYFEKGQMKFGDSPLLGFSNMLDLVIEMTSGLDKKRITKAILQSRHDSLEFVYSSEHDHTRYPIWSQCSPIKKLATAKDSTLRLKEVNDISHAITTATSEYWYRLERWLNSVFDLHQVDEVIIGGGAAYHLEPELEVYFNCQPQFKMNHNSLKDNGESGVPMVWDVGIQDKFMKTFNLEASQDCMVARMLDSFGLFEYLLGLN